MRQTGTQDVVANIMLWTLRTRDYMINPDLQLSRKVMQLCTVQTQKMSTPISSNIT